MKINLDTTDLDKAFWKTTRQERVAYLRNREKQNGIANIRLDKLVRNHDARFCH